MNMKVLTFSLGALRTNTYFCYDETGACVVIDPGMDGEGIYEKLQSKGLCPTHILLTHGHFDHSQGVKALKEKTGAQVLVHREDGVMLTQPGKSAAAFYYRGDLSSYPTVTPDILLEEGDEIQVGEMTFQVSHTPGHTPGSVCFQCENMLFCGDTVFASGYGRYDLWGGDKNALGQSISRIAGMDEGLKICPGHGNTTALGRIRNELLFYSKELQN